MQCIDTRDLLSAYIDDVLGPRERFEVEKHIAVCSACRQELDELKETVRLLRSLGEVAPPVTFRQDLMARISERSVTPMVVPPARMASSQDNRKFGQLLKRYGTIAAAAVIVGIGICIGVYQLTFGPQGGEGKIVGETGRYSGNSPSNREWSPSADQYGAQKTPKTPEASGAIALADKQLRNSEASVHSVNSVNNATMGVKASVETDKNTAVAKSKSVGRGINPRTAKTASTAAGVLAQTPEAQRDPGENNSAFGQPSLEDSAAKRPLSKKPESKESDGRDPNNVGPEMGITSESSGAAGKDSQDADKNVKDKVQKMIRTADIQMAVENYKAFSSKLRSETEQHLGYLENSTEDLVGTRTATFVIRVPVDNFGSLISRTEEMGTVTSTSLSGSDVSGEYADTEARIQSLSVQEQRLLVLINRAGSPGDLISLESELSRVRSQIETLRGRINSLDNMVAYSTIRLRVTERKY